MVNGVYIRVALSNNSDFMCFQKTPRDLYLGQCLVTFSLSVVHGYHVYRSIWMPVLGELLYTDRARTWQPRRSIRCVGVKVVDDRRTHCNY